MSATSTIQHKGFIESITEEGIRVRFRSLSACADCHAKGLCSASDMKDKEVTIRDHSGDYSIGEEVNIVMNSNQGTQAVLLGYVYPFLLFLLSLLVLNAAGLSELIAGAISLGLLVPYFVFIFVFRKNINQKFSFSLRKES